MRIGLFSDVHGNAEALEIALGIFESLGVDELVFLGDAVGYLPGSRALQRIVDLNIQAQAGNHEHLLLSPELVAPQVEAQYLHEQTRATLPDHLRAAISSWPSMRTFNWCGQSVLTVHGSPDAALSGYIYPDTSLETVSSGDHDFIFMGHTHRPFIRKRGNSTYVNVGSVGLPRDHGSLGAVCVFEPERAVAEILRFDISEATRRALGQVGPVSPQVAALFQRVGNGKPEGRMIG